MFNDYEDKSISKSENMDDFMGSLNSRLQGIESGEKLGDYITKDDYNKSIADLNARFDQMDKLQNKGSESQETKIESQKIEQEKQNQ